MEKLKERERISLVMEPILKVSFKKTSQREKEKLWRITSFMKENSMATCLMGRERWRLVGSTDFRAILWTEKSERGSWNGTKEKKINWFVSTRVLSMKARNFMVRGCWKTDMEFFRVRLRMGRKMEKGNSNLRMGLCMWVTTKRMWERGRGYCTICRK